MTSDSNLRVKVFDYLPELDAFLCTDLFKRVNRLLGLEEWTPVCWIGRLFARDQDFGEHWFDNWDDRSRLEARGLRFDFPAGEDWGTVLVVNPVAFRQPRDKTCIRCRSEFERLNCPECDYPVRVGGDSPSVGNDTLKLFWTDVLRSLELSLETLFAVAAEYASDEDGRAPAHRFEAREEVRKLVTGSRP